MKGLMMNVDTLSRPELLTFLSILEGELEAQDTVIHTLRASHRDSFVQERYGQYDLSDPFLALQRDSQTMDDWSPPDRSRAQSHPRAARRGLTRRPS
ncbi:hypothetical protein UPYG_G00015730 [Umbra pygmaea]|uniref:Cortactin-binding protein-2 N-terminal domain-containing protein n=1 Tax=Umbra pygmaea TaxID=75934 RepID=A0ABD0XJL3_UMBPY